MADKLRMGEPALRSKRTTDIDASDLGRPNTIRYNVLTLVINEDYEKGIKVLKDFLEGGSEYPNFRSKTERYVLHGIDLIYAIRTKRNFPGLASLTRTKQQELKERFREHFKELKFVMRKIEECMEELRVHDARSTIMVVRSFALALTVVFIAGLVLDLFYGLGATIEVVASDYIDKSFNFILDKFL